MGMKILGTAVFGAVLLMGAAAIAAMVLLCAAGTRALVKYCQSSEGRKEKALVKKSLGDVIKQHREACGMTQEFVAESIGVSRQAVSKWESGASDPSTSHLIALAKLFQISPEALLQDVQSTKQGEKRI